MSEKKHWQTFGEHSNSEAFQQSSENEFKEDLQAEGLFDAKTPRRDFLKYLGFSTAAAALAASCEIPVKKVMLPLMFPEAMWFLWLQK
jgi:MoCo/4Fe-4S cofactor protein with predicted Tat translocation signal